MSGWFPEADTWELDLPMRGLGASYYSGCRIPFEEFLVMCEGFGMDFLEIQAEHPFTPCDLDTHRIGDVVDALSSHRLRVTVHGPLHDVNLSSLKDGIREASVQFTRECVEMTYHLGGSILVVHGGTCPGDQVDAMLERSRKALEKSLKALSGYARNFGVRIAIENKQMGTDRELVLYPEDHLELVSNSIDYEVGAVLDVGHANTTNRDLAQYALMLGTRLTEIHLHDNMGTSDDHLPLGTGTVCFPELFSVLKELDFRGPTILELKTRQHLEQSLKYLESRHRTVQLISR